MKNRFVFTIAAALGGNTISFAADQAIAPIVVNASQYEYLDTDAPYASEVHSQAEISRSGAVNLYDYLKNRTSVTVSPSSGNTFSQKLDMRGYGIGDGYQNIVVTIDGQRLNNIDMSPQVLSGLPLEAIERIEIVKGSGSVINGDGAMAGVINIYTRNRDAVSTRISAGNYGVTSTSLYAGISEGLATLNVTAENYHHDGFGDKDTSGQRDEANSSNLQTKLKIFPTESLELRLGGARTRYDTVYHGSVTEDEFDEDPGQNSGSEYNSQKYSVDNIRLGTTYDLLPTLQLKFDHIDETKNSKFTWPAYSSTSEYKYTYQSDSASIHYNGESSSVTLGLNKFNGLRSQESKDTEKNNSAVYIQAHYFLDATTLSAGVRREKVDYTYNPDSGSKLSDKLNLTGFDLGLNHRLNQNLTLYSNFNSAYQAPDIDRFFTYGGSFNDFIKPAKSQTLNVGLNHTQQNNKLKLTLFYSRLTDEIYYYSGAGSSHNTNIDKSHKTGLELQDTLHINQQTTASLNYAYTRAIIDEEDEGNGLYDGKVLPGVSAHTATVSLAYRPDERSHVEISHTYRSEAYAAEDFANDFEQKQAAYNSTDVGYNYRIKNMKLFAKIENLFGNANGTWIKDDKIYPFNYTTNWLIGVSAEL